MANQRYEQFLASLSDPRLYVRRDGIAVFDSHEEKDKSGRVVRRFGKHELEAIARRSNERDSKGNPCPLTIGHTDPEEINEEKQPEIVGCARNFRVSYDDNLGRWVIKADYYIRRDRFAKAQEYPRPSVEFWPQNRDGDGNFFDPIALLKRTPQRDLGQWTYSRSGDGVICYARSRYPGRWTINRRGRTVLRYAMQESCDMDPEDNLDMPPEDGPGAPPPPPGGGAPTPEEHESFARHVCSHPLAQKFSKHYAMDAMDEGGAEPPPPPDPTDMPSADEPPEQYSEFASASNGGLPEPTEKGRYRKDAENIKYAKLRKEMDTLKHKTAIAESRQMVTQLVAEGYDLDPEVEVPEFARLSEQGREKRADHIRRYYRQAPVANYGRVPVEPSASPIPEPRDDPRRHDTALRYMREHPGLSYDEALEQSASKGIGDSRTGSSRNGTRK